MSTFADALGRIDGIALAILTETHALARARETLWAAAEGARASPDGHPVTKGGRTIRPVALTLDRRMP